MKKSINYKGLSEVITINVKTERRPDGNTFYETTLKGENRSHNPTELSDDDTLMKFESDFHYSIDNPQMVSPEEQLMLVTAILKTCRYR